MRLWTKRSSKGILKISDMDLKICINCDVLILLFLLASVKGALASKDGDCRMCKPGYYVYRRCNELRDTICAPCPEGSFTFTTNLDSKCSLCSLCGVGLFELKRCTATHDVFCESCSSNRGLNSIIYKRTCLYGDSYQSDQSDLNAVAKIPDNLEVGSGYGENDLSEHKDNAIPKSNSSAEGGRVLKLFDSNDTGITLDKNSAGLDEGSGDVSLTGMDRFTKPPPSPSSTLEVTVFPEEAEEDELLPVHTKLLTTTHQTVYDARSTVLTGVSSGSGPDTTTTTEEVEVGSGIIVDIGDGIILQASDNSDWQSLTSTNYVVDKQKEPRKGYTGYTPSFVSSEEGLEPSVGASTDDRNDDTDKVTIGIIIAVVLVAGILLFALGFVLSRYCRRRNRSFQVKKAEKGDLEAKNGEVRGVGYPPYHGGGGGIYDEIDRGPNGHCRGQPNGIKPENPEHDLYAIPLKKSKAPVLNAIPPIAEAEDSFAGLEGIRFIDETSDEESEMTSPTERLLKSNDDPQNNQSSDEDSKHNRNSMNTIKEEKIPMLSNGHS